MSQRIAQHQYIDITRYLIRGIHWSVFTARGFSFSDANNDHSNNNSYNVKTSVMCSTHELVLIITAKANTSVHIIMVVDTPLISIQISTNFLLFKLYL